MKIKNMKKSLVSHKELKEIFVKSEDFIEKVCMDSMDLCLPATPTLTVNDVVTSFTTKNIQVMDADIRDKVVTRLNELESKFNGGSLSKKEKIKVASEIYCIVDRMIHMPREILNSNDTITAFNSILSFYEGTIKEGLIC